jgi:hypothetical protein
MSVVAALVGEFTSSIKGKDTEETVDLILYRPLGFLVAKTAHVLHMTPNQLSILGVVIGFVGASFYLPGRSNLQLAWGSVLFVLAGVFDSADGQLARIADLRSDLGLILDGLCDNLVFIAVYVCAAASQVHSWGGWIFLVAVLAGLCHSVQSAVLDFYHREYSFFGRGNNHTLQYWNPSVAEALESVERAATRREALFQRLRVAWIAQQQRMTTRTVEERLHFRALSAQADDQARLRFQADYRALNRPLLKYWRFLGANAHTMLIIVCVSVRHFDLYLVLGDIVFLNAVMLIMRRVQERADQKLLARWPRPA